MFVSGLASSSKRNLSLLASVFNLPFRRTNAYVYWGLTLTMHCLECTYTSAEAAQERFDTKSFCAAFSSRSMYQTRCRPTSNSCRAGRCPNAENRNVGSHELVIFHDRRDSCRCISRYSTEYGPSNSSGQDRIAINQQELSR